MTTASGQSSAVYESDETLNLLSPPLWSAGWGGTSSHFGFPARCRVVADLDVTSWAAAFEAVVTSLAEEVRRLRDQIIELTGLTKQEIARSIGVDRRSLSGYVTGEIRPSDERLMALRVLAEVAGHASARFGERAREVLRFQTAEGAALDLIAAGRIELGAAIDAAAANAAVPGRARVTVRRRHHRPALYLKARDQWSDHIDQPTPGGVAREQTAYEQDLSKAPRSPGRERRSPRRKRI